MLYLFCNYLCKCPRVAKELARNPENGYIVKAKCRTSTTIKSTSWRQDWDLVPSDQKNWDHISQNPSARYLQQSPQQVTNAHCRSRGSDIVYTKTQACRPRRVLAVKAVGKSRQQSTGWERPGRSNDLRSHAQKTKCNTLKTINMQLNSQLPCRSSRSLLSYTKAKLSHPP